MEVEKQARLSMWK